MSVFVNTKKHRLEHHTMLFLLPGSVLFIEHWAEFSARCLFIDTNGKNRGFMPTIDSSALLLLLLQRPCRPLYPELHDRCVGMLQQLQHSVSVCPISEYDDKAFLHRLAVFAYSLIGILRDERTMLMPLPAKRSDEYFLRFMRLLSQHYVSQRRVNFYAQNTCLTPKYLTTIVKRMSGRNVGDWINEFVMAHAIHLLRFSNLSVQQISHELNFPNQSFFGSFFKNHTGYSPTDYRKQMQTISELYMSVQP